jgi:regulator of cell morphogenesis and NO signaling
MAKTEIYAPTTVGAFIAQNLARASALHGYGISLFTHASKNFDDVCTSMGLVPSHLTALLEQQAKMRAPRFALHEMPIRLMVEYLRHTHHLFIRERLPFLMYLIGGIEPTQGPEDAIIQDLRMIFPLFAEEFIAHIHEEEDTLFGYIADLERASKNLQNPGALWLQLERWSIGTFAADHEAHDDAMEGLRTLTNHYAEHAGMSLPLRVLYYELAHFERDLAAHASIENKVLLPKALRLESYVRSGIAAIALRN